MQKDLQSSTHIDGMCQLPVPRRREHLTGSVPQQESRPRALAQMLTFLQLPCSSRENTPALAPRGASTHMARKTSCRGSS